MPRPMTETVAILGATDNRDRFAYRAMLALVEHGHKVLPINPFHDEIDGTQCFKDLAACTVEIDTITVYVSPGILRELVKDIVAAKPGRVILNPGTEDQGVISQIREVGIKVQRACTLVLLSSNQYMPSNL